MKLVDKALAFIGFEEETAEEKQPSSDQIDRKNKNELEVKRSGQVISLSDRRQRINVRVVITAPREIDELKQVAHHLMNGHLVLLNLEETEYAFARRVIDFVGGAVYGLDGKCVRAGNGIFLFVPRGVEITSEMEECILKNAAGFMPW